MTKIAASTSTINTLACIFGSMVVIRDLNVSSGKPPAKGTENLPVVNGRGNHAPPSLPCCHKQIASYSSGAQAAVALGRHLIDTVVNYKSCSKTILCSTNINSVGKHLRFDYFLIQLEAQLISRLRPTQRFVFCFSLAFNDNLID